MTIANKLTYLAGTKTALREAINAAGGNLAADTPFRQYARFPRDQSATLDLQFWCERFIARKRGSMAPAAIGFSNIVTFTRSTGGGVFNEYGQFVWRAVNEWRNDHDPASLTTSTSTASFESGSATFTLPTGHTFFVGDLFRATATAGSIWGIVTARSATSVTIYVRNSTGTGSASSWTCIKPRGFLIEEQRTNLLLNSDTLATQSRAVTATAHTLTFYGTGTVTLSGAFSGTLVGTGATSRASLTFTPTAASLTLTVTGSCTQGQLEVGAFPTSYIPTVASQVTRAADVASVNTLSPWYNASEGTLSVDIGSAPVAGGRFVTLHDGTINNQIFLSNGAVEAFAGYTGVFQWQIAQPIGAGKLAGAYAVNNIAVSKNGGAVSTDTTASIPAVTTMSIGKSWNNATFFNGRIRSIQYLPRRLTNAELQAITT